MIEVQTPTNKLSIVVEQAGRDVDVTGSGALPSAPCFKNCREPFTFASPAQGMKLSLCCALLAAEVPNLRRDEGLLGPVVSLRTLLGKAAMQGVVVVIEMCCNVHLPMRWLYGSSSSLYALSIDLVAVEGSLLFALVVSLRGTEILPSAHLKCHQNMIKVTIMEVKVRHCGGERALIQEVYRDARKVDAVFR